MQQTRPSLLDWRAQFYGVFALVSLVMALGSIGIVYWIANQVQAGVVAAPKLDNDVYTNYNLNNKGAKPYISAASTKAVLAYIQKYPQPQNVQILKGYSTAQIYGYMQQHFAGGLKVDCTYCHNLANFADDANPNKGKARLMLLMTADLNQNYVALLPKEAGAKQIGCATCHNGKPKNFNGAPATGALTNYPADQSPLPDTWTLPLDNLYALQVTGRKDPDLNLVEQNQYTMNHFNYSLGVGCTFCHNANYFPSNEKPQKAWALTMLNMNQHIKNNYYQVMGNKLPSCWMCHQQQQLPPGSVNQGKLPAPISTNPGGQT